MCRNGARDIIKGKARPIKEVRINCELLNVLNSALIKLLENCTFYIVIFQTLS